MKDRSSHTLYAVVSEGPGQSPVARLRFAMASEALNDAEWRELYDEVRGSFFGFPENFPDLLESTSELPRASDPEATALGQWLGSANHCATPLRLRAAELGVDPSPTVSDIDLVASVVAAELWCAALAVVDLTRAASLGVDAVSSLAAILARASGYGVGHEPRESIPGNLDPVFNKPRVREAYARMSAWAEETLGYAGRQYALQMAAKDLAYRAEGMSATEQAALLIERSSTLR